MKIKSILDLSRDPNAKIVDEILESMESHIPLIIKAMSQKISSDIVELADRPSDLSEIHMHVCASQDSVNAMFEMYKNKIEEFLDKQSTGEKL